MVRAAYVHGLDIMLWACAGHRAGAARCWRWPSCPAGRRPVEATGCRPPALPAPDQAQPADREGDRDDRRRSARPCGLRERKKARTRAAIREHALRLFREQGYPETTVEQIAAAAEVSPSTFFRYFPTKEDVVLQDDMDARMIEALERQPPGLSPLAAVRAAAPEVFGDYTEADLDMLSQTTELTMTVPEVRARALDEFARTIKVIGLALAKRTGRAPDDLAVRTIAGAIVGVIMSITMPWEGWSDRQTLEDTFQRIEQGLALSKARPAAVSMAGADRSGGARTLAQRRG